MRKRLALLLILSLTAVSALGCGTSSSESGEKKKTDDQTLTVWTWDPNFNIYAMEKAAELYREAGHEEFQIEISEIESQDIETKLTTVVSSGDLESLPDIFLMRDESVEKFVKNYPDIFTDLTDSGIDFSEFSQAKVAFSTVEGKNMGIPFDSGTAVSCFRTDYLEQAGFTVDDFTDITWSEFAEKAKIVKEKTGHPMLTAKSATPDLIMIMLQSCGASLFDEEGMPNLNNNEALKESMEIYIQMVKDGTLQEMPGWDQYIASLNDGTAVCALNGCWILASVTANEEQTGKWAVTNVPRLDNIEGATNYSSNGGSTWVITSNCKNKDLAIDFFKNTFAGSTELYEDILSKGAFATWLPGGDAEAYTESVDFFGGDKIYEKIVAYSSQIPSSNSSPYYYDARDAMCTALSNVIQNNADLEGELKSAQETVEFNIAG